MSTEASLSSNDAAVGTFITSSLQAIGGAVRAQNDALLLKYMLALFEFTATHPRARVPIVDEEADGGGLTLPHYIIRQGARDEWYRDRTEWMLMALAPTMLADCSLEEQRDILCEALRTENDTAVALLLHYFGVHVGATGLLDAVRFAANPLVLESFLNEASKCAARKWGVRGDETDDRKRTALHAFAAHWLAADRPFYADGVITRVVRALLALDVPADARDDSGRTASDYLRLLTTASSDEDELIEDAGAAIQLLLAETE